MHIHTHLLLREISYHWMNTNKKNWVTEDSKRETDFSQCEYFWAQNFELCSYITYMKSKYKWEFTQSDPFDIRETCGEKESLKRKCAQEICIPDCSCPDLFSLDLFLYLLPLRCITALVKLQMFFLLTYAQSVPDSPVLPPPLFLCWRFPWGKVVIKGSFVRLSGSWWVPMPKKQGIQGHLWGANPGQTSSHHSPDWERASFTSLRKHLALNGKFRMESIRRWLWERGQYTQDDHRYRHVC